MGSFSFYVEHIYAGVNLEQEAFSFHHRFTGDCTDVTEAENGGTVRNHSNEIAFCGVIVGFVVILFNFTAWFGDTWRISKAEVRLRTVRLGRDDFNLTRFAVSVVGECLFFKIGHE